MPLAVITEHDLENKVLRTTADNIWNREKIQPLTVNKLYNAIIYSILSAREQYPKLKSMMLKLKENNLTTPKKIIPSYETLKVIVPWDKAKYIIRTSEWWMKSDLGQRLINDYTNKKNKVFDLKKELIKNAIGMEDKCANLLLRMMGYEGDAPLDVWALRYLRDTEKYDVIDPDYNRFSGAAKRRAPKPTPWQEELFEKTFTRKNYQSGPTKKEYKIYKGYFDEEAELHNFTPARFQCFIWAKYSTWNEIEAIIPNQQELFGKSIIKKFKIKN